VTAASRARFAEVVRSEPVDVALACLLIDCETEPELDLDRSLAVLEALAASVGPVGDDPAEALRRALGGQAGFSGHAADYGDVRASLLHEVLRRGRGLPILLAVVWCEVAARCGIRAVPLGLPGHVLVRVGADTVVDPFNGGRRVPEAPVEPVLEPTALLLRVLANIRALTTRQERSLESARTRLWATELSLLLPRHPVSLRRERGELLVRLGDHLGGAEELEDYASVVGDVDEAEAEQARRGARQARARLN
jgi:hypothetical protein